MNALLGRFLDSHDPAEVLDCAVQLSRRDDPEDMPTLLDALGDAMEERRWGAVYACGFSRRDRRAVVPLMNLLLDRTETPWVRGQAAECLGYLRQSRAIKPLIRCSRDASPEVRFWCVFALGHVTASHGRKLTRAGIRALEARLDDMEAPRTGGYWPIRYEALAALESQSKSAAEIFRHELRRVLADPVGNAELWKWAQCYAEDTSEAAETIVAAGLDPATLGGRSSRTITRSESPPPLTTDRP